MSPTLHDGDVVLARFGATPRPGDVVLVGWAARPGQLSVKRAVRPDGDGWWVLGDNPFGSTDSSTLGPAQRAGRGPRRACGPAPDACAGNPWARGDVTPIRGDDAVPSSCTRPPTPVRRPPAALDRAVAVRHVRARTHGPGARRSEPTAPQEEPS